MHTWTTAQWMLVSFFLLQYNDYILKTHVFLFTGWRKRYCSLDKTGFKYFKSEHDTEVLGEFPVDEMLSVTISEDESSKDPQLVAVLVINC